MSGKRLALKNVIIASVEEVFRSVEAAEKKTIRLNCLGQRVRNPSENGSDSGRLPRGAEGEHQATLAAKLCLQPLFAYQHRLQVMSLKGYLQSGKLECPCPRHKDLSNLSQWQTGEGWASRERMFPLSPIPPVAESGADQGQVQHSAVDQLSRESTHAIPGNVINRVEWNEQVSSLM